MCHLGQIGNRATSLQPSFGMPLLQQLDLLPAILFSGSSCLITFQCFCLTNLGKLKYFNWFITYAICEIQSYLIALFIII
jgi:hypothetical protein